MPTKAELLRLQQLYHTDKRIAEALGGNVSEHLVQYWRRKKGIPRTSYPKYSEAQIRELWERFGDDFRCGRELGLAKAGFYSWRRRYGIKDKPHTLKLEQLELRFGSEPKMGRNGVFVEYYKTVAEKILARCAGLDMVEQGQTVDLKPDMIILDPSAIEKGRKIEHLVTLVDKTQIVTGFGALPAEYNELGLSPTATTFAIVEQEIIAPNILVLRNSAESAGLSAFSAMSLPLTDSQLDELAKNGSVRAEVPSVVRLTLHGRLQRGVAAFDIFAYAVSHLSKGVFESRVVEYTGSVIEKLSILERYSLCHLTPASTAYCGYTPFDEVTRRFLARRGKADPKAVFSDSKAYYNHDYVLTISGLEAQVAPSSDMAVAKPISEIQSIESIGTVFIGGPCGGGIDQLRSIAETMKGRHVSDSIRLYVSPLTQETYVEAMKRRILVPMAEAGAIILPAGMTLNEVLCLRSASEGALLATPFRYDRPTPPNCWYVSHLTAAESSVSGRLTMPRR
jgi:3-isopropylmalate/(R)-2-methylmalate dehydratase large subunit